MVLIPRSSRDELVDQTDQLESTKPIAAAFLNVGGFRSVAPTLELEALLYEVLEQWVNEVGVERMPEGLWDLRVALAATLLADP
jgi:hypothetical protein